MTARIRIGTRGSRLALAQAGGIRDALAAALPGSEPELIVIKTSGDRFVDRPLREIGGKGLFVKEIEQALVDGAIDCAVHSMKDLPGELAPGLVLAAVPNREDPRDVLVTRSASSLEDLPRGARIGTSSTRRRALCRALRPDLELAELRGNVDTRLRKLENGEVAGILLAAAGLRRLGVTPAGAHALDPTAFVPAIGQGALALETRDDHFRDLVGRLDHAESAVRARAERAVLAALGGSCHTPIAAHAVVDGDTIHVRGVVVRPDGGVRVEASLTGAASAAEEVGYDLARALRDRGADAILEALDVHG